MILYVYRISALCCFQCSFPCPPDRFSGKELFPVSSELVQPLWLEPLSAAKRCFRFHQRTLIVYHSLKALSTTFLFFLPALYRCFALSRVSFYILPTELRTVNYFSSIFLFFSVLSCFSIDLFTHHPFLSPCCGRTRPNNGYRHGAFRRGNSE